MQSMSFVRGVACVLALASLTEFAAAQALTAPVGPYHPGKKLTITYHCAATPNTKVKLTITNSSNNASEDHEIQLDANGRGSYEWTIQPWPAAHFNCAGAAELAIMIELS